MEFKLRKLSEECAECSAAIQSFLNAKIDKEKEYTEQEIQKNISK